MINVSLKPLKEASIYQKNVLYKISESCIVNFTEEHADKREIVFLDFSLKTSEYGIFAHEYRSPNTAKEGCKTTDILACIVNEDDKKIYSHIVDVKSNISAFSDNLLKDQALLTAIKEIRDFIWQVHDELLHKKSFMIYYKDGGYTEYERVGIATKSFESNKFLAVADKLKELLEEEDSSKLELVELKLKNSLRPYKNEVESIRNFANKKIKVVDKVYGLQVYILEKIDTCSYATTMTLAGN